LGSTLNFTLNSTDQGHGCYPSATYIIKDLSAPDFQPVVPSLSTTSPAAAAAHQVLLFQISSMRLALVALQ